MSEVGVAGRLLRMLPRLRSLLWLPLLMLAACACAPDGGPPLPGGAVAGDVIVVAFDDRPESLAAPGASPGSAYRRGGYAGSDAARALAAELAQAHHLAEVTGWTIAPLRLYCLLFRLPPGADREALIHTLAQDGRVALVQPLNEFETRAGGAYNDPYLPMQKGFAALDVAPAHRYTQGEHVRVAVIDTGIDKGHPDLAGRVESARDFVGGAPPTGEAHGTEVAGIMAASANNGIGIVGVAPQVQVLALRACWAEPAGARCNSFTLAQALAAAIASGVDVINLSLGGPHDDLLQRLTGYALGRGTIVVAALPPDGRWTGFPADVPGVIAVSCAEDAPVASALAAPCRDILTLTPGGHYDFASGSSMAAAHVSGAVALLRSVDRRLSSVQAFDLLGGGAGRHRSIDVCGAVLTLREASQDDCRHDTAAVP